MYIVYFPCLSSYPPILPHLLKSLLFLPSFLHTPSICISPTHRYTISPVYHESKVLGAHPREQFEAQFDIVTPSPPHSDNIKSVHFTSEK